MPSAFFRRRIIFQAQASIGAFGANGPDGAAGAAGAPGAAGSPGLGPTSQDDLTSAEFTGAFVTPIEMVPAVAGSMIVPLVAWSENDLTTAGSNSPQLAWGWPGLASFVSWSSGWSGGLRNAGNRDYPNYGSLNSAFGTPLAPVGDPLQMALSAAPTGAPVATARLFVLYFEVPMLIV